MEFIHKNSLELMHENILTITYSMVSFLVPFLIGHPQFLVGIIVNAALVASSRLKGMRVLPVIILPSLAVIARGIIFGPFTPFLLYMVPAIWLGNASLAFLMRHIRLNHYINLGIASLTKTAILFGIALVFVTFGILPDPFLTLMGINQLITAVAGGMIVLFLFDAGNKVKSS